MAISPQATQAKAMACCGVREIQELQHSPTPKDALIAFVSGYCKQMAEKYPSEYGYFGSVTSYWRFDRCRLAPRRLGHVIFTQADKFKGQVREGYGEELAKYIEENGLGLIGKSVPAANPNYTKGHTITVYIWTPAPKKLWTWWLKNKPKGIKDVSERPYTRW